MWRKFLRGAGSGLLLVFTSIALGHMGLSRVITGEWPWMVVWIPSGIAAGALVTRGIFYLPAVAIAAFLSPLSVGFSAMHCLLEAAAYSLEALTVLLLVRRWGGFPHALGSIRELRNFLMAALVAPILPSILIAAAYIVSGVGGSHDFGALAGEWWWGDLLGIVLVMPLFVAWDGAFRQGDLHVQFRELVILLALITGFALILFGTVGIDGSKNYPVGFLAFPIMIWTALRFGQKGAALATSNVAAAVIWATSTGMGPFGRLPFPGAYWVMEAYLLALAITGLVLAAVMAELNRSLDRRESILGSMAEGLLLVDSQGMIQKANRSAATILGRLKEEMEGQFCVQVLGPQCPRLPVHQVLFAYVRPDRVSKQLRCNCVELEDGSAILTFRDATHEEEVGRLKAEFTSMTNHELRTPLAIVKGYVDILARSGEMGVGKERQMEILERVRCQTNRLVQLVDDLLNLSKLEEGLVEPQLRPVDLAGEVNKAIEEFQPMADAKGLTIVLDQPLVGVLPVLADPQFVGHILGTLLDNAIKYTLERSFIVVQLAVAGRFVRMTVSDRGIGIPASELSRAFHKFHRIPHPLMLRERGTGLGLYMARKMAEMQGGMLIVSSVPDSGTVFALTLPVASPAA